MKNVNHVLIPAALLATWNKKKIQKDCENVFVMLIPETKKKTMLVEQNSNILLYTS